MKYLPKIRWVFLIKKIEMLNRIVIILFFITSSLLSNAQGIVEGTIIDSLSTEPIPFARVKVEGQNAGANTDFDGNYKVKLPAGEYVLVFSMSMDGYVPVKKSITVIDGQEINLSVQLHKSKSVQQIETMQVVHVKTEGAQSIEADDARRREAKGSSDGMSKEQIQNTGASSAVEAVQMVPGLSIEDGKSVYVRGLGDRYSKTILNGMVIPGLDPDRNSVQMDIFPSTIIDNITVYKTFTPNLAGDFTGGLVDITTTDFPSEKTIYFKAGLGYNTQTTFNKDYISYKGGKYDFLGFDDGTRAMPVSKAKKFSDPTQGDISLTRATNSFGKVMATEKAANFLNQNYAFSLGDRFSKQRKNRGDLNYGYNFVLNYRNSHRFYQDAQFNEYRKDPDASVTEIYRDRTSTGDVAENNVLWTALLGQSIKFNQSKISLTLFHTQNGMSSASSLRQVNDESNPATLVKQNLTFTQRSVSNLNINGRHFIGKSRKWRMDWKLSPTYSKIDDPDIRSTVLEEVTDANGEVSYALTQSVGAEIRRIYRNLSEYNVSGRIDFKYSFVPWDSLKSEISFGALNTYKHRNYEVYDFIFDVENAFRYSEDPNWYFESDNIWNPTTDQGTYVQGERQLANSFEASQNVTGAYVMNDLPLTKRFNATYGVRVEKAVNHYTGQNNVGDVKYVNKVVLDEINVLPSVNLVYKIEKKGDSLRRKSFTNIRAGYSSTVARPSFKEKSISQIYDPIQGRRYNGNIDLKQTTIHNVDLRWEYFYGRTELISVSAFYKKFIDPIEVIANVAAPNEVQPINAGIADLYGAEIEIRKAIGFANNDNVNLVIGTNLTLVYSQIDMRKVKMNVGGVEYTEQEIRSLNAREGEDVGNFRPMYGQSPYIINAFLNFSNSKLGLTFNSSYNVQGKKLAVIGVGGLPDVYEQPFHSLNMKITKTIGADRNWKVGLQAKNILMSTRLKMYESYNSTSQIYSSMYQGMTITGSVSFLLKGKKKR